MKWKVEMDDARAAWVGAVPLAPADGVPILQAVVRQGGMSAASPFLGLCSDGKRWWIKPPVVGMRKALVSEYVVGRLGALIGAPVCAASLIQIPAELLPCEYAPGKLLVAGVACGSLDIDGTPTEIRGSLTHRPDDDNRRRHAGVYALVDWFFGSDLQWLLDSADDWTLYSHDHGWYLPPGGPNWSIDALEQTVDDPCSPPGDSAGLDEAELDRLASALEAVSREDISAVLQRVPREWDVDESELEVLGWYLERRAVGVAERLRFLRTERATA